MSQFDWGVIDPNSKSGPQLALDLNNFRDALNSLHRGALRPPYAQPGMLWVKEVSAERWELCLHDGSLDLMLRAFNPTTSEIFPFESSDVEGLDAALAMAVPKDAATTTGAAIIPGGGSAQRPSTPGPGMLRFNTDLSEFERYQGGKWLALNAMDKALNEAPIVTLASAATVNIGAAASNTINISGANAITAFDVAASGVVRRLVFQGALQLTHNATSLILPGAANITTASGDSAEFVSLGGGNWRCLRYQRAAIVQGSMMILGASQVAGGTAVEFTGIPTWVKRVTLSFTAISTNGNSTIQVQIGAGSIDASGYLGCTGALAGTTSNTSTLTSGITIDTSSTAASSYHGSITFNKVSANSWSFSGVFGRSDTARVAYVGGSKSLVGDMDRVRLTTEGGANLFDAGTVNIIYEG